MYIAKSLFSAINTSASGLSVQRTRMNIVSENLANIETTRTENGGPYRRKIVQVAEGRNAENFSEAMMRSSLKMREGVEAHSQAPTVYDRSQPSNYGVHVSAVVEDPSAFRMVYDPHHPDANSEGYVAMPNINAIKEMMELITASRGFEANVTALNTSKDMIRNALKIGGQ